MKKRQRKTMDIVLIILALSTLIFTITMIYLFSKYQTVPDTLITCFFSAVIGECGGMSWIKTTKERTQERLFEVEDRKAVATSQQNKNESEE